MSSTINTNISSLAVQRSLYKSQGALATSMQRLSSGLRVNSAKDDAAGLAIGERMTTQIRGTNVAIRNANDAISLAQVAEGSMGEMNSILQRCRELSVQAANGTYSKSDREAMDAERIQLFAELERINTSAEFNGQKLLDGSFTSKSFQVGANAAQTLDVSIPKLSKDQLGYYHAESRGDMNATSFDPITSGNLSVGYMDYLGNQPYNTTMQALFPGGTLSIAGNSINIAAGESAGKVAEKINALTQQTEVVASASTSIAFAVGPVGVSQQVTLRLVASEDYSKAVQVSFMWDGSNAAATAAAAAINAVANQTGVTAEDFIPKERTGVNNSASFHLTSKTGETIHVINDSPPATELFLLAADWTDSQPFTRTGSITFAKPGQSGAGVFGVDDVWVVGQISLESNGRIPITQFDGYEDAFGDQYGYFLTSSEKLVSLNQVSFESASSASKSLKIFDGAMQQINSARANLGAVQSRLESTIRNLQNGFENISASRSRIMDADFASETSELARAQILQNAGMSMVAQANSVPNQVLALLKF